MQDYYSNQKNVNNLEMQLKKVIDISGHDASDYDSGSDLGMDYRRHSKKRDLILTIETGNAIIESFVELYNKYIGAYSEYTINITSFTRAKLSTLLEGKRARNTTGRHQQDVSCLVQQQLIEKFEQLKQNPIYPNGKDEIFQWLLSELIETTDTAATQISMLMNGSFIRFKQDTSVFDQALQLAQESLLQRSHV